jgi:DNA-binding response OmpR family regulator
MPELARVLVVEDDRIIREVLTLALEDEGYVVRSAVQGQQALEQLRTWPADLIVLDLMLPVMDGWTFLRERQRLALCPGCGGHRPDRGAPSRSRPRCARWRHALALAKPFELDELLAALASLLRPGPTQPR